MLTVDTRGIERRVEASVRLDAECHRTGDAGIVGDIAWRERALTPLAQLGLGVSAGLRVDIASTVA